MSHSHTQIHLEKKSRCSGKVLALTLLSSLFYGISAANAEDLVVLKQNGTELKLGQTVDGSKPLTLQAGQSVTLIESSGKLHDLTGPYNQAPISGADQQKEGVLDTVDKLWKAPKTDSGNFGVTRSVGDLMENKGQGWVPAPWLINVSYSGNHCTRAGQTTVFWRPDGEKQAEIRLQVGQDRWVATTTWPAGWEKLSMPDSMPIFDGEKYHVKMDNQENVLTLHVIPENITDDKELSNIMEKNGCQAQKMALLNTKP
ncbi:MAG: hypothetical protein H7832_00225 [Magnetococcus sp. DMHC-6]